MGSGISRELSKISPNRPPMLTQKNKDKVSFTVRYFVTFTRTGKSILVQSFFMSVIFLFSPSPGGKIKILPLVVMFLTICILAPKMPIFPNILGKILKNVAECITNEF